MGSADDRLALSTGVVLLATLLFGSRGLSPRRLLESRQPFPWLSLAASGVYALGPMALFGCWFFFQRAGYVLLLWLPGVVPRLGSRRLALVQASLLVLRAAPPRRTLPGTPRATTSPRTRAPSSPPCRTERA